MVDINTFLKHVDDGEPSIDDYGRGMHLCFKNAEMLLNDAEVLKNIKSPRALSLGILALEEIGKLILLCDAAGRVNIKPGIWVAIKKRLSSHRGKQELIATYGSAVLNKMRKDGKPYYENEIPVGLIPLLERMKQWGFYVDCVSGHFQSPENFVRDNEDWTDYILTVARERLESIRPMHDQENASVWIARATGAMVKMMKDSVSPEEFKEHVQMYLKHFQNNN